MALSQTMKNIIDLMRYCGVTLDGGIVITGIVEEAGIEEQMLNWMMEQDHAPSESELLKQAMILSGDK